MNVTALSDKNTSFRPIISSRVNVKAVSQTNTNAEPKSTFRRRASRRFFGNGSPNAGPNSGLPPHGQRPQNPPQMPYNLWHENHSAAATDNLLIYLLGHGFRVLPRDQKRRRVDDPSREACACESRAHANCPYFGRVVLQFQLHRQPLMKCNGRGLGTAIRDRQRSCNGRRDGCDGDDGAVVGRHHCREELADEAEMAEDVDLEDFVDGFFSGIQQWMAHPDSGVVDKDCGTADFGANRGGAGSDFLWGSNVTLEEGYIGRCRNRQKGSRYVKGGGSPYEGQRSMAGYRGWQLWHPFPQGGGQLICLFHHCLQLSQRSLCPSHTSNDSSC